MNPKQLFSLVKDNSRFLAPFAQHANGLGMTDLFMVGC